MSTEFFSKLGEELISIKNSPFHRPGSMADNRDPSLIRSQLSYNPDRLFNVEKYNESKKHIQEEDLAEAMREEQLEADKAQFQILKNATLEDYERRVEDLNRQLERGNTNLTPSIFKIPRTVCTGCNKCAIFRGNFKGSNAPSSRTGGKRIPFLCCIHCGCPMGAHAPGKPMPYHRPYLWKHLKTASIQEEYIDFEGIVVAFRVKNQQANQELLWQLGQLLERMGFKIQNQQVVDKNSLEFKFLRCYLLGMSEDSGVLEGMIELSQCIYNTGGWKQDLKVGEQFRENYNIIKKIATSIRLRSLDRVHEDEQLAVYLLQNTDQTPNPTELKLVLKSVTEYLPNLDIVHVSQTRKDALFEAQQLFPSYFQLHRRVFVLPETDKPEENAWKFQGMLDYNGYSSFIEGIKDIQRMNLEKILDFMPYHEMTYLLGKNIASNRLHNFGLYYSIKAGSQNLKYEGQIPSFLQITDKNNCEKVINTLLPSYLLGQRCMVIIRPLICQYSEAIVNILRLNNFIIVQRRKQRITMEEAHFISALEHIQPEEMTQYLEMMTSGPAELILVSKRGALFQAQALLNSNPRGLSNVNTRWLPEQPTFERKKGKQIFKQELNLNFHVEQQLFRSGGDLISLQKCLLGTKGRKNVLQNCKTGELIVVEGNKTKGQFKGTTKQREQILKGLREDTFNNLLFSSKSDKTTQELASIFFPQTTQFDAVVVIVKPAYYHLIDIIKETLVQYRYHSIFHKSIVFSKLLTYELLTPLQKVTIGGQSFDQIAESFIGNRVSLLCISKTGAYKQILAMLSAFTFLPSRTVIDSSCSDILVKEALIPVWNNQETFLKLFNRHLGSLEEAVSLATTEGQVGIKSSQKMQLFEYFIGSILGVRPTDSNLNTSLGHLLLYNTTETTATYRSWYYATMSQIVSDNVPILYQYRSFKAETIVLQTHPGEPFMSTIVNQFIQEEKIHREREEKYSSGKKNRQRSLVLLLWAKKLFQLLEKLSGFDGNKIPEIQVEGWGSLIFRNGQHVAERTGKQAINNEKIFLQNMLIKYKGNRQITTHIKKLLESRLLLQRYEKDQRRLLPTNRELALEESIRVIQTGLVGRLYLQSQFQMLDPDTQKQLIDHDELMSLKLFRMDPHVMPKYQFFAEIFIFFQRWKEQALEYRQVFAQIYEHLKGFISKYDDLQFLEYEVYLQKLKFVEKDQLQAEYLHEYPVYRQKRVNSMMGDGQELGKNRKFIEQKHYFKELTFQTQKKREQIQEKYGHFNLKTLEEPLQHNILNKQDDPLHKRWNNQQNYVSLLRQPTQSKELSNGKKGIYVEYQKKQNEKQENVKSKIQMQISKLDDRDGEGTVMRDNGLDPDIYYKRVKHSNPLKVSSKLDSAIKKQLDKLTSFKQSAQGFNQTQ